MVDSNDDKMGIITRNIFALFVVAGSVIIITIVSPIAMCIALLMSPIAGPDAITRKIELIKQVSIALWGLLVEVIQHGTTKSMENIDL